MLPVLRNTSAWTPTFSYPMNRLDTFFDRFLGEDGGSLGREWSGMPVAMWDDEDNLFVEAEMPGVSEHDVEVTVHNGMLFIRGECRPEEGRRYLYNGRSFGRFERVMTLPEAVKTDDVQATLKDGILFLTLPKSPEAKPKKIMLQTG